MTKRVGDIQEEEGIRGEEIKRDKENRLTSSTFTDKYTVSSRSLVEQQPENSNPNGKVTFTFFMAYKEPLTPQYTHTHTGCRLQCQCFH